MEITIRLTPAELDTLADELANKYKKLLMRSEDFSEPTIHEAELSRVSARDNASQNITTAQIADAGTTFKKITIADARGDTDESASATLLGCGLRKEKLGLD